MSEQDLRPPVWVGHVVLETDRLAETAQFMRNIGLRPIVQRPGVAVLGWGWLRRRLKRCQIITSVSWFESQREISSASFQIMSPGSLCEHRRPRPAMSIAQPSMTRFSCTIDLS